MSNLDLKYIPTRKMGEKFTPSSVLIQYLKGVKLTSFVGIVQKGCRSNRFLRFLHRNQPKRSDYFTPCFSVETCHNQHKEWNIFTPLEIVRICIRWHLFQVFIAYDAYLGIFWIIREDSSAFLRKDHKNSTEIQETPKDFEKLKESFGNEKISEESLFLENYSFYIYWL